jgi:uncharacterized membrane protein YccC
VGVSKQLGAGEVDASHSTKKGHGAAPAAFCLHLAGSIRQLAALLWSGKGALFFGIRLWASVCLALYVAFWLELDNAYWAGASAAIVCQPSLGASLRKASYRMVGTVVGAAFIVVLSAAFPQDRVSFLLGLALWIGACTLVATVLKNFAAYAAALAGFTAAIIAADELGAVGGTNGQVFMLAVWRTTEIWIGIIAAGIVLAGTDLGSALRRLTEQSAALLAEVGAGFLQAFTRPDRAASSTTEVRRGLLRRASALDAVADEAIGESSEIHYRSRVLQNALDGLFASIEGWSVIANHLEQLPHATARENADAVLNLIPSELQKPLAERAARTWIKEATPLLELSKTTSAALYAMPSPTPSLRLLADGAAKTLADLSHAINGVVLLNDPSRAFQWSGVKRIRAPDLLPALVNALRAFLTTGAVSLFWIVTAWSDGASAIVFAAIGTSLFALRGDLAPATAVSFLIGTIIAAALAAIVKFALLPNLESFLGFSIAIGLVLVPLGALLAQPWETAVFLAGAYNFIPLLAPANEMTYDTIRFYNQSLAIIVGIAAAVLAFALLPQVSPPLRARRLLALTLRDFRQLAAKPGVPAIADWIGKVAARLSALPAQAELIQFARLGTALSAGAELIRLRSLASTFGFAPLLDPAFKAIAHGQSQNAIELLAKTDAALSRSGNNGEDSDVKVRARASILRLSEALSRHGAYFDGRALE